MLMNKFMGSVRLSSGRPFKTLNRCLRKTQREKRLLNPVRVEPLARQQELERKIIKGDCMSGNSAFNTSVSSKEISQFKTRCCCFSQQSLYTRNCEFV